MKIEEGEIEGVIYHHGTTSVDLRGKFKKFYSENWKFAKNFSTSEVFLSTSLAGVLRGMHLQINDSANDRIVSVLQGEILDVLIDLRRDSPTFLKIQQMNMGADLDNTVFIPAGVAHGFQALMDSTTLYLSSKSYSAENDVGIDALSFGLNWPISNYIRSQRDLTLPPLEEWFTKKLW